MTESTSTNRTPGKHLFMFAPLCRRVHHLVMLIPLFIVAVSSSGKTLTYNHREIVNLRDRGIPTDERAINILLTKDNIVYGCTSGDRCHVFRFDPKTQDVRVLATLPGPNTVFKGMVYDDGSLYVGTMPDKRQLWLRGRELEMDHEFEEVHLIPIDDAFHTGRLYRVSEIESENPVMEDLGVPVEGEGIHTLALDPDRSLIYGVTYPGGRFFIYDIKTGESMPVSFGNTYTNVSNHMVGVVEVRRELAELIPGEGEWNNRLVPRAMLVREDGTMFTSGWRGQVLKYDPTIEEVENRFSAVGYIPSVPGRQYWNRIDAMVEREGKVYFGTSDGYLIRLDPETGDMKNLGKPVRSIETMGLTISPLDGNLYGVSGGGLEGMSRFWSCDPEQGTFEVDIPALEVIPNRRRVGDLVCTEDGTIVLSESTRVGNLFVLTPGERKDWEKSGVLDEIDPQESPFRPDERDRFQAHKQREVEVFPIPSAMHGGSGYTAIQSDRNGNVYVGTAYYGETARLVQLDPDTARWREIFRADRLTHQYGRGQGMPGKIHTKLRLGSDGKIYGAMKQGYELHYSIRPDVGEAPDGHLGTQHTCHFFSYDPESDTVTDLGPGWPQEGITSFDVDVDRGYIYGATVPGVFFLVHDLETGRVWNAGAIGAPHPSRYMPVDHGTGRAYQRGESTPEGREFMTVWNPNEFRLRDYEILPEEGFAYRHSYASCVGEPGSTKLYGHADGKLFEMDLEPDSEGKLRVRPVCDIGVEGEVESSMMYAIERGPDGRIYWTSAGGNQIPLAIFAWDPETETKTYLGSCALGGEWLRTGHTQGLCLDQEGNLAIHMLYVTITDDQKEHWGTSDDFYYKDIEERPYYLSYPRHLKGTYYAVYYLRDATSIW